MDTNETGISKFFERFDETGTKRRKGAKNDAEKKPEEETAVPSKKERERWF